MAKPSFCFAVVKCDSWPIASQFSLMDNGLKTLFSFLLPDPSSQNVVGIDERNLSNACLDFATVVSSPVKLMMRASLFRKLLLSPSNLACNFDQSSSAIFSKSAASRTADKPAVRSLM
jgi:hypothetical protein